MADFAPRSPVVVPDPTANGHPAHKGYVDSGLAGRAPTVHSHPAAQPAVHAGSHHGGSDPVTPGGIGAALAVHDHDDTIVTKTANYTLVDSDDVVIMDTTGGVRIATLPTAVGRAGHIFTIKKVGMNMLTIATTSSQTIDGILTENISMMFGYRTVISDGSEWHVIGGKIDPVIINLADTGAGGTLTINAAAGTIYRGRLTGSTATMGVPTNPVDGDVINIELFATVGCTLTLTAAILETGGLPAVYTISSSKVWNAALRYRAATSPATVAAAWRLLAASVDN